jgi:mono/diheme cytochrome c family protein
MTSARAPAAAGRCWRIAALALLLAGLPAVQAQEAAAVPSAEDLRNPEWVQAGREKFGQTCAYCHGKEGDSGKNRPFRERIDWDPVQIHDVITNGRKRGANVMPAWKGSLSDDDIWRITAFIRSLGGQPRAQP